MSNPSSNSRSQRYGRRARRLPGQVCAATPADLGISINASRAAATEVGLRLDGRYRLIKQVGSGGMSVVFDANDEILQRRVAVKMIAPALAADPSLAPRLLVEARRVATLRHPNITAVYDFGVHQADDGTVTPYLVMEMLDGELLSDALRLGRLPWRQAVSICAELAAALAAAHAAGIVHRDISPSNIMLTPTGVKVLDFGIAALIGDAQNGVDGDIVGTAPYLAPERLGRGNVTASADVYAAGLVLYRCLAGHLPWNTGTVTEMLYAHARIEPRRLPPLGLPLAIEDACHQCLAREPHHRPSAAELAHVLAREVQRIAVATPGLGEVPAHPPKGDGEAMTLPLDVGRRRSYQPPRPVLAAAGLCGVLALGYIWYPTAPQTAPQTNSAHAVPCSISYITSRISDHEFDAAVTVTNTAPDPIDQWTLQFSLPAGESVVSARPATEDMRQPVNAAQSRVGQQDRQVTVTNASGLASGTPVSLTLSGRYGDTTTQPPTGFTLNGRRCDTAITLRIAAQPPDAAVPIAQEAPANATSSRKPTGKRPKGNKDTN